MLPKDHDKVPGRRELGISWRNSLWVHYKVFLTFPLHIALAILLLYVPPERQ